MKATLLRLALGLGALVTLAACSKSIGDECMTSIDCSSAGDRTCDIAQPGGYCTIDGCDNTSCPSEAVCIRFFPEQFLTKTCDPDCVCPGDCAAATDPTACTAQCLACQTQCSADEICVPAIDSSGAGNGLCSPRADEQRVCEKACSSNGDCRGGYMCRKTGIDGAIPYATDPNAVGHFCSPVTTSSD